MKRIKEFTSNSDNGDTIENQVDEWIKQNPNLNIISITASECTGGQYNYIIYKTCYILYDVMPTYMML